VSTPVVTTAVMTAIIIVRVVITCRRRSLHLYAQLLAHRGDLAAQCCFEGGDLAAEAIAESGDLAAQLGLHLGHLEPQLRGEVVEIALGRDVGPYSHGGTLPTQLPLPSRLRSRPLGRQCPCRGCGQQVGAPFPSAVEVRREQGQHDGDGHPEQPQILYVELAMETTLEPVRQAVDLVVQPVDAALQPVDAALQPVDAALEVPDLAPQVSTECGEVLLGGHVGPADGRQAAEQSVGRLGPDGIHERLLQLSS